MRCPQCGADNLPSARVCKKCLAEFFKVCPNCGSKNPSRANFCKDCGWPIKGVLGKTNKAVCNRCGSPVDYGSPSCPSCGAQLVW